MKKTFLKNLVYGAVGLAILGGTHIIIQDNNILKPRDFDEAKWMLYDNKNGRIESCYKKEDVPQNLSGWDLYMDKVREKNNYNLEGRILLPDLDGDGKVGK